MKSSLWAALQEHPHLLPPGSSQEKQAQHPFFIQKNVTRRLHVSQVANSTLFFLFDILFCSFLGSFCSDAKEPSIGAGHAKTGKSLEVLLLLCDDPGFLLLVDLEGAQGVKPLPAVRPVTWPKAQMSAESGDTLGEIQVRLKG